MYSVTRKGKVILNTHKNVCVYKYIYSNNCMYTEI